MSSTLGQNLNKRIRAQFSAAEYNLLVPSLPPGTNPVAVYTHRVSEPKGVSITGFDANLQIYGQADINQFNSFRFEILENTIFQGGDQTTFDAVINEGSRTNNSMLLIIEDVPGRYCNIHRQYESPLQFRFGTSYSIWTGPALNVSPVTDFIVVSLTVYGFPNVEQGTPHIQMR